MFEEHIEVIDKKDLKIPKKDKAINNFMWSFGMRGVKSVSNYYSESIVKCSKTWT